VFGEEEALMIARYWSGEVPSVRADDYQRYLEKTGIRDLSATSGNRGVYVLRRTEGDRTEFVFVSLWESLDAIRAFAGEEVEKARYYPEDREYLLEMSRRVKHYEVAAAPQTR
jgi:heme-degrading monooxygenase HmoA